MKNLMFICTCALLLAACCQKAECVYYVEKSLVFNHFNKEDLDTVVLVRYQTGSNFTIVIDSSMVQATDGFLPYSVINLSRQEYAFKVRLPATGQTYFIDDFVYKKVKDCNSCFPARAKWAYMDEFTAYSINGKQYSGKFISIE